MNSNATENDEIKYMPRVLKDLGYEDKDLGYEDLQQKVKGYMIFLIVISIYYSLHEDSLGLYPPTNL